MSFTPTEKRKVMSELKELRSLVEAAIEMARTALNYAETHYKAEKKKAAVKNGG